jgi:sulfite exporter TauE/SafE
LLFTHHKHTQNRRNIGEFNMPVAEVLRCAAAFDVLRGHIPCPLLYKCVIQAIDLFCGVDVPMK